MNNLQEKYYKVSQKLELIIQDQDWDSPYWDYLLKLKRELSSKGFLVPSECKKIMNWTLTIY